MKKESRTKNKKISFLEKELHKAKLEAEESREQQSKVGKVVETCYVKQKNQKNKVKTSEENEPSEKNESTEREHFDDCMEPIKQHLKVRLLVEKFNEERGEQDQAASDLFPVWQKL